jgi:hypothetical protein
MNERIKELAEQADDYTDNKIQQPGEYHPDWHDVRDQKFAELIVRECATIADDGYGSAHFGNGIAGYQLLQHFGVKE